MILHVDNMYMGLMKQFCKKVIIAGVLVGTMTGLTSASESDQLISKLKNNINASLKQVFSKTDSLESFYNTPSALYADSIYVMYSIKGSELAESTKPFLVMLIDEFKQKLKSYEFSDNIRKKIDITLSKLSMYYKKDIHLKESIEDDLVVMKSILYGFAELDYGKEIADKLVEDSDINSALRNILEYEYELEKKIKNEFSNPEKGAIEKISEVMVILEDNHEKNAMEFINLMMTYIMKGSASNSDDEQEETENENEEIENEQEETENENEEIENEKDDKCKCD